MKLKSYLILILILILFNLISLTSHALETDQFITVGIKINDSAPTLNEYISKNIEKAVDYANQKNLGKTQCRQVAKRVMDNLVGGKFSISKISQFAKKSPLIDKYPDMSVSDREYFKMTYYKNSDVLLKVVPLARTINLNGIYMGTDKLGHFALIGRHYYGYFLDNLKDGLSVEVATEKAILKGFKTEKGILGYAIGGVLSFGDLEANYQGLVFAKNMCEGENPYLAFEGKWKLNPKRVFDTKEYFGPKMDESFHFNFWRPGLYKRIQEKLQAEYCAIKNSPEYLEKIQFYQAKMTRNINDMLIEQHINNLPKFDRALEDVSKFCD